MRRLTATIVILLCILIMAGCQSPTQMSTPSVIITWTVTPTAKPTVTIPITTPTMGTVITPPAETATPFITLSPSPTPTRQPTETPTKRPTATPTKKPTATPKPTPTPHPTPVVTPGPNFNSLVNPQGGTIETRFLVPDGFERVPAEEGSFAEYLRSLPLKADGSPLHYIDGSGNPGALVPSDIYSAPQAHAAILDIKMLNKNEQCADTIIHLYAEYLYAAQRYDEIVFTFSDGFKCDFVHYTQGYRYSGGKWVWKEDNWTGTDRQVFELYLKHVYEYANTYSLYYKDLEKVNVQDISIGDMFIVPRTSSGAGHVVLVCDMIKNSVTGEVRFMTLQGSMPAVEAHVMMNAEEAGMSPWQNTRFENGNFVSATYWTCSVENLRRFK